MLDETTGNITLNRADTFTLEFCYQDSGAPVALTPAKTLFHIGKDKDYLFSIAPVADTNDPTILHFTFTPAHALRLGNKEWDYVIRDEEAEDVLSEGSTISAVSFAIPTALVIV